MYISMPLPPTEQLLNGDSYSSQEDGSQCPHMNAWFGAKGLHITHLNVHYLYPKLDKLKLLLSEQNIDIFCLCETFLNSEFSDNEFQAMSLYVKTDRVMEVVI